MYQKIITSYFFKKKHNKFSRETGHISEPVEQGKRVPGISWNGLPG